MRSSSSVICATASALEKQFGRNWDGHAGNADDEDTASAGQGHEGEAIAAKP